MPAVTVNFKMDALSIQQPWAWMIVNNHKPVENRTWATKRRGMHLIHTGQKFDQEGYEWVVENCPEIPLPKPHEFERGGIVGMADLIDCVETHPSPLFFGPFGFVFAKAVTLPFIKCRGALGFFRPKLPLQGEIDV